MTTVTQEEAIINLPNLIDAAAERGDEIVVTRDRIAVAKIVPLAPQQHQPSHRRELSREQWLALLHRTPPIGEYGPSPTDESLRREHLYDDRS